MSLTPLAGRSAGSTRPPAPTSERSLAPAALGSASLAALVVLVMGSLLLAALLAPAVDSLLAAAFGQAPYPLARIFNRLAVLICIGLLIALRRRLGLAEFARATISRPGEIRVRQLFHGALLALVAVAVATALALALGELTVREGRLDYLLGRLPGLLIAGLLIGVVEEGFFRGIVFGALRARLSLVWALVASSAFYSGVHLLASHPDFTPSVSKGAAGLEYLGFSLARVSEPGVPNALFGLALFGGALALVYELTGSFWMICGLHAGAVIGLDWIHHGTAPVDGIPYAAEVARRFFVVGEPWAWTVFLVMAVAAWALRRRPPK